MMIAILGSVAMFTGRCGSCSTSPEGREDVRMRERDSFILRCIEAGQAVEDCRRAAGDDAASETHDTDPGIRERLP